LGDYISRLSNRQEHETFGAVGNRTYISGRNVSLEFAYGVCHQHCPEQYVWDMGAAMQVLNPRYHQLPSLKISTDTRLNLNSVRSHLAPLAAPLLQNFFIACPYSREFGSTVGGARIFTAGTPTLVS